MRTAALATAALATAALATAALATAALATAALATAALAGCGIGDHPFRCSTDESCGADRFCEPEGYCSVAAPGCERSQRQWDENAPADLVGTCVKACVADIVAGGDSTCAILDDGRLRCWGDNAGGQLALGSKDGDAHPLPSAPGTVLGGATVTALALGAKHACARREDGVVVCWGQDDRGQCSGTPGGEKLVAVEIGSAADLDHPLAVGLVHSCAIQDDGQVKCWGDNQRGQIGADLNGVPASPPVLVRTQAGTLTGATALAAGANWGLASAAGGVWSWGGNDTGQLGNDTITDRDYTEPAGSFSKRPVLAAGRGHGCTAQDTGLYCWGDNSAGQLGRVATSAHNTAGLVDGTWTDVTALAAGNAHTCALVAGATWCWGDNADGQLGTAGAGGRTPTQVPGLAQVRALAAGDAHTCALTVDGRLYCWGAGSRGQLGDGATSARSAPRRVALTCE